MKFLLCFLSLVLSVSAVSAQNRMATLRPGDAFEMRLQGMPVEFSQDFNAQYTVSQEGTVNVPLVGAVQAVGATPPQLEKSIQAKLVEGKFFTRPTVNINLIPNNRFVSVGGGVRQPQRMVWTNDLTLNSAVQIAGGLSDFASEKGVRLIREGKVTLWDLRQFVKQPETDPKLLPGDQIIVRQ